jgi:phosphatidylserine/phosphatidylglycerophosphate/cardiolipin synthase-like enzyme
MVRITKAHAYCNNEVGYLAWDVEGSDPGLYGFELTRIYLDAGEDHKKGERRVLPAWVPFEGQTNAAWKEQDTSVWPIQGLFWRDLTLRRRRDSLRVRSLGENGTRIRYEVRGVGKRRSGLPEVPVSLPQTYEGDPVPLSYYTDAFSTDELLVTDTYGAIQAAFTNGILSSQWLSRQIDAVLNKDAKRHAAKAGADAPEGKDLSAGRLKALKTEIANAGSPIREYLTGDVLSFLKKLLERASDEGGQVLLALYELADKELVDALLANKKHVRLILSNSSKGGEGDKVWDAENAPWRQKLVDAGVDIQHRMFNNAHIGHNKFAVYLDKGKTPRAILSGSTNWTPTGLCAQSNNAILITDDAVAEAYAQAWQRLYDDKLELPDPLGANMPHNVQGEQLREANMKPADAEAGGEGRKAQATSVRIWYSPNTKAKTKKTAVPPDLADAFALIDGAKQAVFFLVFMPSRQGIGSVVEHACKLGQGKSDLLVAGAVSDPSVLPNYVAHQRGEPKPSRNEEPHEYKSGDNLSVVQADALFQGDLIGDFEAELKSAGHAIIHDKIVVVDPLSDNCAVMTGSHNLGLKASYENDENLLIIKGNRALAEAYMIHVLDVYDHYRWRARRAEATAKGAKPDPKAGHLKLDSKWLAHSQEGRQGRQARYLAQE